MRLNNLSIAKRLALVLGTILALCLASSLFAIVQLRKMSTEVQAMVGDQLRTERLASDWYLNTYGGVQRAAAIAKSSDASLSDYFAPVSADAVRQTNVIQQKLEALMASPEEVALFARIGEQRKVYLAARDGVYRLKKEGDAAGALKVFSEKFEPESRLYMDLVQQLAQLQRRQLDDGAERIDTLRAQTDTMLAGAAAAAMAPCWPGCCRAPSPARWRMPRPWPAPSRPWISAARLAAATHRTRPAAC